MSKIKITNLKKDTYFKYNGIIYQKVDDYNINNDCLNIETGQIEHIPLMSMVEKTSKPKRKRKTKDNDKTDIEKNDSDGLRDGRAEPTGVQPSPISSYLSGPETTGDSP